MRQTVPLRSRRQVPTLLILLGVVSLLMMPVDYRAGAAIAHPHAISQLLGDAARGSLTHHDDHQHAAPPQPDRLPLSLQATHQALHGVSFATATINELTALLDDRATAAQAGDEPSLSPRSGPGTYAAYPLALLAGCAMFWRTPGVRLHWPAARSWQGRNLAPDPPPPRPALLGYACPLSTRPEIDSGYSPRWIPCINFCGLAFRR